MTDAIEWGLNNWNWEVRASAAGWIRTLTTEQIERGLTDKSGMVRKKFASRSDFSPTREQMERGLADDYLPVRKVYESMQAKWEADELKKRHASVVITKPKLEAL